MNLTLAALLGLGLGQPPAPEYHPFNSRSIKFPIQFAPDKVKSIRNVELYACKNGDQVWERVAFAPPTQDQFTYTAPDDGRYWFHIVTVDLKGNRDPANLVTEPPAMKVLFDTRSPAVAFTNVRRTGDEVAVEWKVDDQFPKDEATRVYFRPASATDGWQEVTVPPGSRNGVRFPAGTSGPLVVRVTAEDLAGNTGEGTKDVPGADGVTQTSTSMSPGRPAPTPPVATGGPAVIPPPDFGPPPALGGPATPAGPVAPPSSPPAATGGLSAAPPAPPSPPAATGRLPAAPTSPAGSHPVPTFDPRNPLTPASAGTPAAPGYGSLATGPVVETTRAQVINTLRFDLNYQVEQRGPSGISRVDLWVTRDDGRSWVWWSQHDGRQPAVKVNLGTTANLHPEGLYGFRLVPVSGAGLSEPTPVAGDAPDIRVVVDVTAPVVKIFPPAADPNSPESLVLQWEAADKNFGEDPISLEWGEGPIGPWHPVAGAGAGVEPGQPVAGASARRLPNTGRHSWHVPSGMPPRVYLKVTARDAAGNATEQVTREPILIDLTKPRAKITGIGTNAVGRP